MSQNAQFRIRDTEFWDSIIARWQRSKEFCNKSANSGFTKAIGPRARAE